jgi:hypothetical protein|tara:strand:- start:169 stop:456 length:288 start_codon:yes stop_codon:yes gene_type:complete
MLTLHDLNFAQGFVFGLIVGSLITVFAIIIFGKKDYAKEDMLAWTIVLVWLVWHIIAGFTGIVDSPPNIFDIVSGGAVGFVLGEKFMNMIPFFKR